MTPAQAVALAARVVGRAVFLAVACALVSSGPRSVAPRVLRGLPRDAAGLDLARERGARG